MLFSVLCNGYWWYTRTGLIPAWNLWTKEYLKQWCFCDNWNRSIIIHYALTISNLGWNILILSRADILWIGDVQHHNNLFQIASHAACHIGIFQPAIFHRTSSVSERSLFHLEVGGHWIDSHPWHPWLQRLNIACTVASQIGHKYSL